MKNKIYLYLNKNSFYIYSNTLSTNYQSQINVAGVQNAGEMPL